MLRVLAGLMLALLLAGPSRAQLANNFGSRQAIVLNTAPAHVELSGFSFQNEYQRTGQRLVTKLAWRNAGTKPITAFEVVTLYYDPFNRPMSIGGRWLVTGHDSANWAPLQPGESDSDGLIGFSDEPVLTGIVYVRAIRFEDGSVWYSNQAEVEQKVRTAIPQLKELGALDPGPKKPER